MNKIKYKIEFVVKNTTYFGPLDLLCPYSCKGCGRLGVVLCGRCKKYLCCRKNLDFVRKKLHVDGFDGLWGYSSRMGILDELIKEYKYGPVRGIGVVLADMLDEVIKGTKIADVEDIIIVPLPTIAKHVRDRGFDHMKYIGKRLARKRGWKCRSLLKRTNDTVQVGSARAERKRQAEEAYAVRRGAVDGRVGYLLIDDVWTTGASMQAAAKKLRKAGAKMIYGAVVAVSGKV